jgi:hypothetical protein
MPGDGWRRNFVETSGTANINASGKHQQANQQGKQCGQGKMGQSVLQGI